MKDRPLSALGQPAGPSSADSSESAPQSSARPAPLHNPQRAPPWLPDGGMRPRQAPEGLSYCEGGGGWSAPPVSQSRNLPGPPAPAQQQMMRAPPAISNRPPRHGYDPDGSQVRPRRTTCEKVGGGQSASSTTQESCRQAAVS